MTKTQLITRILSRIDRVDSEAEDLVEEMIGEVLREVEALIPFGATRGRTDVAITAGDGDYELPSDLIQNHDHTFNLSLANGDVKNLTRMDLDVYKRTIGNITKQEEPDYYILLGTSQTENLSFKLYPIPLIDSSVEIFGHYYTDYASWGNGDSNWLTQNKPDVIIGGVAAKIFQHYGQLEKSEIAYRSYNLYVNGEPRQGVLGMKNEERRVRSVSKRPRVRMWTDEENAYRKRTQ
jgi:hypothetical protein